MELVLACLHLSWMGGATTYLADRYPNPQLFVSHGAELDLAVPPQLPRLTAAIRSSLMRRRPR